MQPLRYIATVRSYSCMTSRPASIAISDVRESSIVSVLISPKLYGVQLPAMHGRSLIRNFINLCSMLRPHKARLRMDA